MRRASASVYRWVKKALKTAAMRNPITPPIVAHIWATSNCATTNTAIPQIRRASADITAIKKAVFIVSKRLTRVPVMQSARYRKADSSITQASIELAICVSNDVKYQAVRRCIERE
jgi:hypothetical protein